MSSDTHTYTDPDAQFLETRIPEAKSIAGLEYGAHISMVGWSGYYVRPEGIEQWGIARLTPAGDELPDPEDDETLDEAVVRSIVSELDLV